MNDKILVWDLPVRIFHWLLVTAFIVAYVTEEDLLTVHVWAGYLILGLLVFRIVWGFIGSRHSRFSDFLCSPIVSVNYLKDVFARKAKRFLGHNPAGAWMIILLLVCLLLTSVTGLAVYAAEEGAGPLMGYISSENEDFWEESHEFFANFTVLLIVFHVAGVLWESFIHHENLVRSMIHGFKKAPTDPE